MAKLKDLTGRKFGKLTVVSYAGNGEWNCICDCGNEKIANGAYLRRGTNSCGCMRRDDLSGKRFGMLTVVQHDKSYSGKNTKWICKCDCGKTVSVFRTALIVGRTKSCGCYNISRTIERQTKHGKCNTRLYRCWSDMKQRCTNKNFKEYANYGGRGINVCNEWKNSFINFENWAMTHGYSDGLSIDRIDIDRDYCPENCRWATYYQQARNRTNNIYIEYNGKRMIAKDWAKYLGIPYETIRGRLNKGLSIEEVLSTTHRKTGKKINESVHTSYHTVPQK